MTCDCDICNNSVIGVISPLYLVTYVTITYDITLTLTLSSKLKNKYKIK